MKTRFLIIIAYVGLLISINGAFGSESQIETFQPEVEILDENIFYGDSFTIHAWLQSYDKLPDGLGYYVDVLDPDHNQVDSTLWFAKEDFVYEFDTTHPAYNITKGGIYQIKIEKADFMERTGEFPKTIDFEIIIPEPENPHDVKPPLKQIKSGTKFHNVECKEGLKLAYKKADDTSACVKTTSMIELVIRGWAEDTRILLGCLGDRVEICYPSDPQEYRKALYDYYFGHDNNLPSSGAFDFVRLHSINVCNDKPSVCMGEFDNGTKIRIACDYPIHSCGVIPFDRTKYENEN